MKRMLGTASFCHRPGENAKALLIAEQGFPKRDSFVGEVSLEIPGYAATTARYCDCRRGDRGHNRHCHRSNHGNRTR